MEKTETLQAVFRWIHVVAGIMWIGHLYFFNFVNGPFAGTMDGETKKKVVPQLMPRALYWFRWGAAWTWVTGLLLLLLVFYHQRAAFAGEPHWAGFGCRGYLLHPGAMFGTIMAFNVWMRIWPAQRTIIAATRDGQTPDAALVAMAGAGSRHNTYLSVPLVWMMLNQHSTTFAGSPVWLFVMILVGWAAVYWLYTKAPQVKGF